MRLSKLYNEFFESEKIAGIILIVCTILSLILSNSSLSENYTGFWNTIILDHTLTYWINDLLMAVFFLLVGLEIEREIYIGELSAPRKAVLPVAAAIAGMIFPAAIHFYFNNGSATQSGIGIPMATDIAFALGVIALLGNKIPPQLKIFLTALAIIDDLGAIIIVALFYSKGISIIYLLSALAIFLLLVIMNRLKINRLIYYIIPGFIMWYCMLQSGVHATITGILLAFAIPFRSGNETSPSYRMQHLLHKPVAYLILPIFALANTCLVINHPITESLSNNNSYGIIAGLVIGKPLGIIFITFILVKLKWSTLPDQVNWKQLAGAGMLAGIGFTMSIFISMLAFENNEVIDSSKIAILFASVISACLGFCGFILQAKKIFITNRQAEVK